MVALYQRFTKDLHRLHPLLLPDVDFFLEAETEGDEQGSRFDFLFTRFSSLIFRCAATKAQTEPEAASRAPEANEATRPRYFRRVVVITFVPSREYNKRLLLFPPR